MKHPTYIARIRATVDGKFLAVVPALPGCSAKGKTLEETIKRIKSAIADHVAFRASRGEPVAKERFNARANSYFS